MGGGLLGEVFREEDHKQRWGKQLECVNAPVAF